MIRLSLFLGLIFAFFLGAIRTGMSLGMSKDMAALAALGIFAMAIFSIMGVIAYMSEQAETARKVELKRRQRDRETAAMNQLLTSLNNVAQKQHAPTQIKSASLPKILF